MYAKIPMEYDDDSRTLTIGERQGSFPGMLKERTFTVVVVNKDRPQAFDIKAKGIDVQYTGKEVSIKI